MPFYAQTNDAGFVTSVSETSGAIEGPYVIEISGLDESVLGKIYDADASAAAGQPVFVDPPPTPYVPPAWEWLIDIGPFFDRFELAKMSVLTSDDPGVRAILADLQVRKWIDLQREDVFLGLQYVGSVVPAVTAALQEDILTAPVLPVENLALRKLYFS